MNKKKKIKKTYVAPTLKIFTVELENMISISSYTVRSGGPGNEPRIEEWDTKTDNNSKISISKIRFLTQINYKSTIITYQNSINHVIR
ncbi:hypothetical protein [Sphingobacterium daejeonense]|uniref:hypothetical protein n=1 Tax=Sphingobacterium daejeonense TaxID=371142 RepID=UPI0010C25220|nr:hypothetical protein [Sphingobacterium daejeonense]VTP93450.1 Uncharacterised protein [Sphingobacterium daejeonense]